MLWKAEAEAAYILYRQQAVQEVAWLGPTLQARLSPPHCTVSIADCTETETPTFSCSLCPAEVQPCRHVAAALFRWIEIRTTMRRKGPGTMWRRWSRQPFLSLETEQAQRQDLSHLEPEVLLSSLAFQLSLSRDRRSTARLAGHEVEIRLTLPSGDERIVTFHASLLPPILPALRSVPGLSLRGDLKDLELSELRFRPTLHGDWREDGIHLVPGYVLPGRDFIPLEKVAGRRWGRWVRVGHRLCRLLDPPTTLVPYFESGTRVLRGKEALSFLILGDTAAAVVGKAIGRTPVFGKTLEGSIACFVVCVLVGWAIPDLSWARTIAGAAMATLFELLPVPLDDNLRIPLASGFAMTLLAG